MTFWWSSAQEPLLTSPPATAFSQGETDGLPVHHKRHLAMMYEGIRGALATDDVMEKQFHEPPFRVRDTDGWKQHAADFEAEMFRRSVNFDPIDWSEPVTFSV
jgi:hypothetical protein